MKKRNKLLVLLLTFVMAFSLVAFAACAKDDEGGEPESNELGIAATLEIELGATKMLSSKSADTTWSVDKTDVVELSASSGKLIKVKGLKLGTATITAKSGDVTATCEVTVKEKKEAETVTIKKGDETVTELTANIGDPDITLTAVASQGSAITAWDSTNPRVATVANGVVTIKNAGTTTIIAKVTESIKGSVTITVPPPEGWAIYKITEKTEAEIDREADSGKFFLFSESSDEVKYAECLYETTNPNVNSVYFGLSDNHTANFYSFQLFYKNKDIDTSHVYRVTYDVKFSRAVSFTVLGTVYKDVTEKSIEMVMYPGQTAFLFMLGYYPDGADFANNVDGEIKNITFTDINDSIPTLTAPTFSVAAETNVITINEVENEKANVGYYELGFFANADDADPVKTLTVTNGEPIEVEKVKNGTYTVKIRAIAKTIANNNSAWYSTEPATVITVNNETVYTENIPFGGGAECKQQANLGTYLLWYNKNKDVGGAQIIESEIPEKTIDANGKMTIRFNAIDKGVYNGIQLVYSDEHLLTNGIGAVKAYIVNLKINVDKDCSVLICRQEVALTAGNNNLEISVPAHNLDTYDAAFDIFFGTTETGLISTGATFVISDIAYTLESEITKTKLAAPTALAITENAVTFTAPADTSSIAKYEVGIFNASEEKVASFDIAKSGDSIDPARIPAGTYTAKIRAISNSLRHEDSDWSAGVSYTSTTVVTVVDIANGNEAAATSNPGTWIEWHDQNWCGSNVTVTKATLTGGNKIELTFSGATTGCFFGQQLFYKDSSLTKDTEYTLTMKINASAAGKITINGTVVELVEGDNNVSVNYTEPAGASISIQFGEKDQSAPEDSNAAVGVVNGTFIITDVTIAPKAA